MKRLLILFTLFIAVLDSSAQTAVLSGDWYSPYGPAGMKYQFDSSGTLHSFFFSCASQVSREGTYLVRNDSIFIHYRPMSDEEIKVYHLNNQPQPDDTLLKTGPHTIQVKKDLLVYDQLLKPSFSFGNTVFIKGQYMRTQQVYFQLGKYELDEKAFPFLDTLSEFLHIHPELCIEIQKHEPVDPKMSMHLSQRRAEAIMEYLVNKGISKERLTAVGYGESKPIWSDYELKHAKSKDEAEKYKQENRRLELKITRVASAEE